ANAVDHLNTAMVNGFNRIAVGCDVIVADGLKGTEYQEIPIDKKHCKAPKIAAAIASTDIIISLTHFKGHEIFNQFYNASHIIRPNIGKISRFPKMNF
ncbi:unnamed protein product, partial [marine sediment metagenome]